MKTSHEQYAFVLKYVSLCLEQGTNNIIFKSIKCQFYINFSPKAMSNWKDWCGKLLSIIVVVPLHAETSNV